MIKFISTSEFHLRLKRGDAMGDVAVMRDTPAFESAAVQKEGPIRILMNEAVVDLAGDLIKNWVLPGKDSAPPPLLWSHDVTRPPLGKLVAVTWADPKLTCGMSFMPASLSTFAASIEAMIRGGYIRSGSVGFLPLAVKASTDPKRRYGFDIELARLLEFSVVNVPCLPSAIVSNSAPAASDDIAERLAEARRIRNSWS
jgi:prohead serine protease